MALSKLSNENYTEKLSELRKCCLLAESNSILPTHTVSSVRMCESNLCLVMKNSRSFAYDSMQLLNQCAKYFSNNAKYKSESTKLVKEAANLGTKARQVAGSFHDAYVQIESEKINQKALEAVRKASSSYDSAHRSYERAMREAKDKRNEAENWGTAALATFWIPVVNLVTIPGALITNSSASDAERDAERASSRCRSAEEDLKVAKTNKDYAEKMIDLARNLENFESLCEKVAQFWQYQSDKFGTLTGRIENAQIMYECGIQEDMEDTIQEIKKMENEISTYYYRTAQFA